MRKYSVSEVNKFYFFWFSLRIFIDSSGIALLVCHFVGFYLSGAKRCINQGEIARAEQT